MGDEPDPRVAPPAGASSAHELERFCASVLADRALQERLVQENDLDRFLDLVVETGAQRGFRFGQGDLNAAIRANRLALMMRRIVR